MKAEEMRSMEPAALLAEVEKLRRELLELRCKIVLGEDVRPHRVKESKKEIARLLTVLAEKEEERVKA
ncbi:MAG: 50S ribosomal protein L29 [Planctomycetes bacterium]|nr:50S ribosomal protein L29 [Planctomycetota bacterium]